MRDQEKNSREKIDKSENQKNRHINNEETPIYLTSDSTLQTEEEHRHDQSIDPRKDQTIEISKGDQRDNGYNE